MHNLEQRLSKLTLEQRKLLEKRLKEMSNNTNKYENLIALQEGTINKRPPVFCLHPPLGVATYFHNLSKYFPSDIPVYAINSPALEDTSVVFDRVEDMAEHYRDIIKSVINDGEFSVIGHSSGAYIAYEIARQQQAHNQTVPKLVFIDAVAPLGEPDPLMDAYNTPDVHNDPGAIFVTSWLVSLACNVELPFSQEEIVQADNEQRYQIVADFLKGSGFISANADMSIVKSVLQMIANHSIADMKYFEQYNPDGPQEKLSAAMLLIRGNKETEWPGFNITTPPDSSEDSGWDRFINAGIDLYTVDGANHLTIMMDPYTESIAKEVITFLNT